MACASALCSALSAPTAAQERQDLRPRPPIGIVLRVSSSLHENFFQVPDGQPDTTVRAGAAQIRLSEAWLHALGGEVYLDGRFTAYEGFQPTYGTGGGLRLARWAQRLDLGLEYDWWRPRLDVTEEAGRADVGMLRGDYWLRTGRLLELSAHGRFRWEGFVSMGPDEAARGEGKGESPLPEHDWWDHSFVEVGGAARTRVFGPLVSPEVGLTVGRPQGWDPAAEYRQRERHLRIRSMPHDRLYIAARYRIRDRDYPDAAPDASNFGREDRREQLTLLVELDISGSVGVLAYYTHEDGRSTRPGRDFTTRHLSLGMTFRTK